MSTYPVEFKALEGENKKLQKQSDLLTLGILQDKNKIAALEKKVKAQKAYIEELERAI